jgi:DNA-binding transcriptional regulator YdaS (Cro superfamily)
MKEHPIDIAARAVGSQAALATMLGVTRGAVNQWKEAGRSVPLDHCTAIEQAASGAVKRWDLRPDDWHRIWPELIGADGAPAVPEAAREVQA